MTCGRAITWRKKWERNWEQVQYCSDSCRKPIQKRDLELETVIQTLLAARPRGATICPSEAARLVFGEDAWRPHMESARRAARRLVVRGTVAITQGGRVVDPSTARGPIRIRLA